MHLMGDRQVPPSVLVGYRQARKLHMDTGRDECFLGVMRTWGVRDKYENRTGLLDILDDICVDGMLVHGCYRLDMDLLWRLTDCDGRFLVRHYLVGHVPTLVHDICMTLGSFLL